MPKLSLEELFFTLIVGEHEGCDVDTFEIPDAYLHAEIPKDKRILMNLRGNFVDIMCQVNPEYKHHVRYENGKRFCIYYLSG